MNPTEAIPFGYPGAINMGIPTGPMPMGIPTEAMPVGYPGAMNMGRGDKGYKSMGYADVKDNGFSLSGSYGGFSGGIKTDDNATVCDSRGNCMVTDQLYIISN